MAVFFMFLYKKNIDKICFLVHIKFYQEIIKNIINHKKIKL